MSEEVDSGEILKTLVKQGAFAAAREYVDFLESKRQPVQGPYRKPEETTTET